MTPHGLIESIGGALWLSAKIAVILVPALMLYDVLAPLPVFVRLGGRLAPWIGRLGMSPPCLVPLAAGVFLGIAYGAGVIIPFAEQRRISPREIACVGVFLVACHAIVEDTLLFALVGTGGPLGAAARMGTLVLVRLLLAVALTFAFAGLMRRREGAAGA